MTVSIHRGEKCLVIECDSIDGFSESSEGQDVFLGFLSNGETKLEVPMRLISRVEVYVDGSE